MVDLVTGNDEDGNSTVLESSHESNYQIELDRVDKKAPESPPTDSLSKLFKPRFVLNVTAPDGEVIQFTYKRIDAMTMMITHGSPLSVDTEIDKALVKIDNIKKSDTPTTDQTLKAMTDPSIKELVIFSQQVRKNVIQAGVISPQITDDIYDNLDDEILEALYEAISGGVTSQNELVEHFRKNAEKAKT